jgi:hypothetical protein
MYAAFELIHNAHERPLLEAVAAALDKYPHLSDADLLADVACIALNRMSPRYIKHGVDMAFYQTHADRVRVSEEIDAAVDYAYRFVEARVQAKA